MSKVSCYLMYANISAEYLFNRTLTNRAEINSSLMLFELNAKIIVQQQHFARLF